MSTLKLYADLIDADGQIQEVEKDFYEVRKMNKASRVRSAYEDNFLDDFLFD